MARPTMIVLRTPTAMVAMARWVAVVLHVLVAWEGALVTAGATMSSVSLVAGTVGS